MPDFYFGESYPLVLTDNGAVAELPSGTTIAGITVDSVSGLSAKLAGKQPFHGFVNRTSSTLSFDNTSHIFALGVATTATVYLNGVAYTIAAPGLTIDLDTKTIATGLWFIWIEVSGGAAVLNASQTPWSIVNTAVTPCATVYWNGTAGAIGEERHCYDRNLQDHLYKHTTIGSRIANDGSFAQTLPSTTTDGKLQLSGGILWDEDIQNVITTPQVRCRLWYETSAGVWTWKDGTDNAGNDYPYLYNAGKVQYPKSDSGYALTDAAGTDHIPVWVYASNDIDRPIAIVTPSLTTGYSTLENARNAPTPSLPFSPELKLLWRWIYRADGQYQEAADYRTSGSLPSCGVSSPTALSVSFAPAGNIEATNVQAALEELDNEKLEATAYTASDVLTKLQTVDGASSGLDADLLDGNHASAFATSGHNHSGTYEPVLGNPASDGQVLSSTAAGVRSWIVIASPLDTITVIEGMTVSEFADWLAITANAVLFDAICGSFSASGQMASNIGLMEAVIASSTAMTAVAASSTAMTAVIASSTALTAVIASSTAMTAVAASSTAMTAVIASSTALSAVVASSTAMTAVAASSTAMTAVAASSTAMAAVIASSTAMAAVIASSTAMTAVAASSTAMTAVAASSTAMEAVIASSTALTAIFANSTALSAFKSSTSLTVKTIPTMTSNTAPSGVASASSIVSSAYDAWKAFNNATGHWMTPNGVTTNSWVSYDFTVPVYIHTAELKNASLNGTCKDFRVECSNDYITFETALTGTQENNTTLQIRDVIKAGKYRYWRLYCINSYSASYVGIDEMQLRGFA